MHPDHLFHLIADARILHRVTKDPLLPSAIRLVSDAATEALADDLQEIDPTPQQRVAITMIERMRDAYLTLYGFTDLTYEEISDKSMKHER